jgi:hypothetical protein
MACEVKTHKNPWEIGSLGLEIEEYFGKNGSVTGILYDAEIGHWQETINLHTINLHVVTCI